MSRPRLAVLILPFLAWFPAQLFSSVVIVPVQAVGKYWPNGILHYAIDPAIPNPQRILDATQIWNSSTPLQILPRAGEPDYVQFVRSTGVGAVCESALGMVGGAQLVEVLDACTAGMIAHEIGHSFGLEHEQARLDRNTFVTVLYQNVDKRRYLSFGQAAFLNGMLATTITTPSCTTVLRLSALTIPIPLKRLL